VANELCKEVECGKIAAQEANYAFYVVDAYLGNVVSLSGSESDHVIQAQKRIIEAARFISEMIVNKLPTSVD
jgi:hypothetical protein